MSTTNTPGPAAVLRAAPQTPHPAHSTLPSTSTAAPAHTSAINAQLKALFDILPATHELLTRLLPTTTSTSTLDASAATAHTTNGTANATNIPPLPALLNPLDPLSSHAAYPGHESLDIQHLATEAGAIKVRIRKARAAVRDLPAVDRSRAELEGDVAVLERRVAALKGVLEGLGNGSKA